MVTLNDITIELRSDTFKWQNYFFVNVRSVRKIFSALRYEKKNSFTIVSANKKIDFLILREISTSENEHTNGIFHNNTIN